MCQGDSSGMDNFGSGGGGGGGGNNMDRFGPSGMGRMNGKDYILLHVGTIFTCCRRSLPMVWSLASLEMDRGIAGGFDREFGRNEMGMTRNNFGDSFERGVG